MQWKSCKISDAPCEQCLSSICDLIQYSYLTFETWYSVYTVTHSDRLFGLIKSNLALLNLIQYDAVIAYTTVTGKS